MEKAYKLLSHQQRISHREAKILIDRGMVSVGGMKVKIARGLFPLGTKFSIQEAPKPKILMQDENLLAIDKPPFIASEELLKEHKEKGWTLLHRLDKETSGVILLVQEGSEFQKSAKAEFKAQKVYKEYVAIVEGMIPEEREITKLSSPPRATLLKAKFLKRGRVPTPRSSPWPMKGSRPSSKWSLRRVERIRFESI